MTTQNTVKVTISQKELELLLAVRQLIANNSKKDWSSLLLYRAGHLLLMEASRPVKVTIPTKLE